MRAHWIKTVLMSALMGLGAAHTAAAPKAGSAARQSPLACNINALGTEGAPAALR
jgi:hypothetical protein